ncbi:Transposon Ty1-A Gag-Pol polyprotein [Wickerhamomyces ciferrii]|uniref:Transposon Ty1-A Gag-Pol polyprotein n=1 Tax=Wickerhamomyces ciferrii (strain ATCC 14091 / BCRC 22168 / CBS 111 / JCM 3599 / NBRC 0793 / NRRL Y-1031 F-60-10) TaxID=1206466 RepID=K0KKB5_WICCF|nr:Transposon Ty1-A Gag-Pol polyprotein [Wickerhamomyces ciferrii]CCH42607.1 Transposon Ty1-A Gag-Pol polyprotein [Wickerhamomyces ciferrii]
MATFTVITFPSASSNQDVKIAGNFTNWQQESLKFNQINHRFEYKVDELIDGSTNGKYSFKFIVDGNWQVDQDYPSEFDPSGNENNVILYDYTSNKSVSSDQITKIKDQVSHENELEPETPDPTPYNLSKQSTNAQQVSNAALNDKKNETDSSATITDATVAAAASAVAGISAAANLDSKSNNATSITGDKNIEKPSGATPFNKEIKTVAAKETIENKTESKDSGKPSNDSKDFITLTEPTKAEKPISSKRSSIPGPEPAQAPEVPSKTQEPLKTSSKSGNFSNKYEPSLPQPVSRPEIPTPTAALKVPDQLSESSKEAPSAKASQIPLNPKSFEESQSPLKDPKVSSAKEISRGAKSQHSKVTETVPNSQPQSSSQNTRNINGDPNGGESNYTSNPSTTFHSNENTRPSTQLTQHTDSQPPSQGKEFPEYSIGFFATILHVITQFFRRWFGE